MKKVLILSVTAGNGHNACAKGMKRKLEEEGATVEIVDLVKEYSSLLNAWLVDKGYNLAVGNLLPLYNMFYEKYKRVNPDNRYKCKAQGVALSTLSKLYKKINDFQPDVVYCTHFYGAMALTDLKLVYALPCKTIVSNLDYVNSPFWEACIGVDYFAIPNEDFVKECLEEGFRLEQLIPTGLPVDEKFFKQQDKSLAKMQLGIKDNCFTIMVMFGGGHWRGGFKILKALANMPWKDPVHIIMINGRDQSGYKKAEKLIDSLPDNVTMTNVGFTDKVEFYMSASDVIIDKLGGTSATEIINKKLPFVVVEKLAAQEKYNLKYLQSKGLAKSFKNVKELEDILLSLKDEKERVKQIECMEKIRINGIDRLAKLILAQPEAVYNQKYIDSIDYTKIKKNVKKTLNDLHRKTMMEKRKEKSLNFRIKGKTI